MEKSNDIEQIFKASYITLAKILYMIIARNIADQSYISSLSSILISSSWMQC